MHSSRMHTAHLPGGDGGVGVVTWSHVAFGHTDACKNKTFPRFATWPVKSGNFDQGNIWMEWKRSLALKLCQNSMVQH